MIKIIEFAQRFGAPPPDFIFNVREFFWPFYHKRIWSFVNYSRKISTHTVKYCMGGTFSQLDPELKDKILGRKKNKIFTLRMSDDQKQIFSAIFTSKLYVRQAEEKKQPGRFLWGDASLEFLLQFKYCMRKAVVNVLL